MYQSNIAKFQPLLSIDSSTFTGSYQLVGILALPARMITLVNACNQAVTVSFDGTTDHLYFGASNATPQQFPLGMLKGSSADSFELSQRTPIFVKGSAGTGLFTISYVSAFLP